MSKVLGRSRLSFALLLAVAFTFSMACSKGGNTTSNTPSPNSSATSGPSAAVRAYYEAVLRKDSAAAKRYLSAGSIRKLEAEAKDLGKTLDVAYKESVEKTPAGAVPDIGNEKITGDTATVDLKGDANTLTMPMVREGGEWKLAIDKAFPNQRIFGSPSTADSPTQAPPPAEDKEGEGGDEPEGHEEK
jgi:hypothetical protein